ncbi:helix-turn-helix domain-containing protein [Pseudomonas sp. NPDC089401]|uniref:helix-turn-helix domain-containing protein n=1 Tax=Pseudomonas sp. NPDC089401 TaxID=3364462 RepID=UPI0037F52E3A
MSSELFPSVLARLKQLTGSSTDVQLARSLGISPQTLSSWKIRQSIPYSLCVEQAGKHGCSLDWLLLGEHHPICGAPAGADWERDMLERLRSPSAADRQATLLYIKDKQRLQELEQRLVTFTGQLSQAMTG